MELPIIGTIFVVVLPVLAWIFWKQGREQMEFERHAIRLPGMIVDVELESYDDGQVKFPIVEFTGPDGNRRRFKDGWGSSFTRKGRAVTVLYRAVPEKMAIYRSTFLGHHAMEWLITTALLLGMIGAIVLLVVFRII